MHCTEYIFYLFQTCESKANIWLQRRRVSLANGDKKKKKKPNMCAPLSQTLSISPLNCPALSELACVVHKKKGGGAGGKVGGLKDDAV